MSNEAHILDPDVRAVAQALADGRAGRVGREPVDLDRLGPPFFAACVADARAAILAMAARPPQPRKAGPLNALDVAALAADLGSRILVVAEHGRDGVRRAVVKVSGQSAELFDPAGAALFWERVLLGREPAPDPPAPPTKETP